MFEILGRHDLAPPAAHALGLLSLGELRMRDIAEAMSCDASYVTLIVDRLEAGGLATRQASTTDRRVKVITLTPAGQAVNAELSAAISDVPEPLRSLSPADQAALTAIVARAVPELTGPPNPFTIAIRPRP